MSLTGRPDDPPTFCAPAINDRATAQWCVIGALGALQARHPTGKGCVIDTALFDSAVAWVEGPLNSYHHTGKPPQRLGGASFTLVPYQVFATSDRPICIAAGNDRLFVKCARARPSRMGRDPRFLLVRDRAANRSADRTDEAGTGDPEPRRMDGGTGEGRGALQPGQRHSGIGRNRATESGRPAAQVAGDRA